MTVSASRVAQRCLMAYETKSGQEIELKVQRNGKELSFKAVVGVRPGR